LDLQTWETVIHLFKSVRNNFLNRDVQLPADPLKFDEKTSKSIASWEVIEEFYRIDSCGVTRLAPKLSDRHIDPNNFQKMIVKLVTQVFSNTVSHGINVLRNAGTLQSSVNALATSEFLKTMNDGFDLLNEGIYRSDNIMKSKLEDFMAYLSNIQFLRDRKSNKVSTATCVLKLIESCQRIINVCDLLLRNESIQYIRLNRFSQDPLENLFGFLRSKFGNFTNPTAQQLLYALPNLWSTKIINEHTTKNTNCIPDCDISLDWSYEPGMMQEINKNIEELELEICKENTVVEDNLIVKPTLGIEPMERNCPDDKLGERNALRYFLGYVILKK